MTWSRWTALAVVLLGVGCGGSKPDLSRTDSAYAFLVTEGDFARRVLKSDNPVLVAFVASWDEHSRSMAPVLEQVVEEFDGRVAVCSLDVDRAAETARRYVIDSVPTLLVLKDEEIVSRLVGVQPLERIVRSIKTDVFGESDGLVVLFAVPDERLGTLIVEEMGKRGYQPESITVSGDTGLEARVLPRDVEPAKRLLVKIRNDRPELDWTKIVVAAE